MGSLLGSFTTSHLSLFSRLAAPRKQGSVRRLHARGWPRACMLTWEACSRLHMVVVDVL